MSPFSEQSFQELRAAFADDIDFDTPERTALVIENLGRISQSRHIDSIRNVLADLWNDSDNLQYREAEPVVGDNEASIDTSKPGMNSHALLGGSTPPTSTPRNVYQHDTSSSAFADRKRLQERVLNVLSDWSRNSMTEDRMRSDILAEDSEFKRRLQLMQIFIEMVTLANKAVAADLADGVRASKLKFERAMERARFLSTLPSNVETKGLLESAFEDIKDNIKVPRVSAETRDKLFREKLEQYYTQFDSFCDAFTQQNEPTQAPQVSRQSSGSLDL